MLKDMLKNGFLSKDISWRRSLCDTNSMQVVMSPMPVMLVVTSPMPVMLVTLPTS